MYALSYLILIKILEGKYKLHFIDEETEALKL